MKIKNKFREWAYINFGCYVDTFKKILEDSYVAGYLQAMEDAAAEKEIYKWTAVTDRNPDIDMTEPHSDPYFVKYKDGGYDVAYYCNYNPFWVHEFSQNPWWNGAQFCKVEAWMPIKEYKCEEETKRQED